MIVTQGLVFYIEKCEQFGLKPVNDCYYVNQLTQEQLFGYNHYAKKQEMKSYE